MIWWETVAHKTTQCVACKETNLQTSSSQKSRCECVFNHAVFLLQFNAPWSRNIIFYPTLRSTNLTTSSLWYLMTALLCELIFLCLSFICKFLELDYKILRVHFFPSCVTWAAVAGEQSLSYIILHQQHVLLTPRPSTSLFRGMHYVNVFTSTSRKHILIRLTEKDLPTRKSETLLS